MRKSNGAVLLFATALSVILLGLSAPHAQAQRRVQLIDFTATTWRYEASGGDQGTAWQARTFNDTAWPSGPGLLGGFTGPIDNYNPYAFNTVFPNYNDQIITYYFRAHFNMSAADYVWPLQLVMTNLVDDGCLVYLNGNPAGAIRVAPGATYLTPATGGPATEGQPEAPITVPTNGLVLGDNVIAVEVHQVGTGSSDITMGLSLTALVPTAFSIASQPPSQVTVNVPQSIILPFGVSGGPGVFQWQTNNGFGTWVNINTAAGRLANYTNSPLTPSTNIMYRCVASNGVNTVISSTSTVTVLPDKSGPVILSAIVLEEPNRTNRIQIAFNESLLTSTVSIQAATNFNVVLLSSGLPVGISNMIYNPGTFPNPGTPPTVTMGMSNANWFIGSNYCITVNNVRDGRNNVIAPNSRICVSWPRSTNVMQMSDGWEYFDSYFLDPAIYSKPWMATNFVINRDAGWAASPGAGILYKDPLMQILACAGDGLGTEISIQDQPTLFRRTFMLPTNATSANVQMKLRYILDDGAVFYMNGKELLRDNMKPSEPAGTPVVDTTLAVNNVANPTCKTNDNFIPPADVPIFPGMNWMAVAVCQGDPIPANHAEDVAFGLEMDVRVYSAAAILTNPVPKLTITKPTPNSVRLSWNNGFGHTVESTPALAGPGLMWMEVQPNMSNPMVLTNLSTMGNNCFFRLRKVQGQ